MKFILLFQLDEKRWAELPASELSRLLAECDELAKDLVASGHGCGCQVLQPPSTAATLRWDNGRPVVTDGPFAETKEVLAGYQIIECASRDEALQIAGRFPPLRVGASVEVRPIVSDAEEPRHRRSA